MDHRPFEDWLLDDERLTPEQERDLRTHLRSCPKCAALARANQTLRAAPVSVPAAGFAFRFQTRLAAERKVQRRRSILGILLLVATGIGILLWVAIPFLSYLQLAPWQILLAWFNEVVYITFTARTFSVIGGTLVKILTGLIPPYAWILALVLFGFLGSVWTASLRWAGKYAKSVA
jgi:hypothetical protein